MHEPSSYRMTTRSIIQSAHLRHQLVDAGKPVQSRANVHAKGLLSAGDGVEHVVDLQTFGYIDVCGVWLLVYRFAGLP